MYCSDQQIHLICFFSLFNAKTGNGRLDTAKSSDNLLWSLSRSQSPNLQNVSESERSRSIFSRSRSGVGVKNFRLRTPLRGGGQVFPFFFQSSNSILFSNFLGKFSRVTSNM